MNKPSLIRPEIIEGMQQLGFIVTENRSTVQFHYHEDNVSFVTYTGSTIECWKYNDEEEHQRFQLILSADLKTIPSLSEWFMLMHVARIVTVPQVINCIKLHQAETTINNMASELLTLKQSMAA